MLEHQLGNPSCLDLQSIGSGSRGLMLESLKGLEGPDMGRLRPEGMVASAIEFGEVCRKNDFHNFIFSLCPRRWLESARLRRGRKLKLQTTRLHAGFA